MLGKIQQPATITEAVALQQELRQRVLLQDEPQLPEYIAGVDVSHKAEVSRAAIVVIRRQGLEVLERATAELPTEFPYIPGLLSFREVPVILQALARLNRQPDLLMVDGQGIAHPRGLGIAAHLGVLLDLPAMGVAKSRLVGGHAQLPLSRDASVDLLYKGNKIGTVLRSKERCLPLYISPGHRITQDTALYVTRHCLTRYRLPEPTRLADKLSKNWTVPTY